MADDSKLGGAVFKLRRNARNLGVRHAVGFAWQRLREHDRVRRFAKRREFPLRSRHAAHPLVIRSGTSDVDSFHQVFVQLEYQDIDDLPAGGLIIDCGANIGCSAAYFLSRFPGTTVIAVEPDPDNFEALVRNLAPYGARATAILGAVWPDARPIVMDDAAHGDGRQWARRVRVASADDGAALATYGIPELMRLGGGTSIALLKVDIEGAERELFAQGVDSWIERVDRIAIELHDDVCERVFLDAIAEASFVVTTRGELTICTSHGIDGHR